MAPAAFKLRRVLMGVVVGSVLLTLAFYGWVQYRQSQYAERERAVLGRYHEDYTLCLKLGNARLVCGQRVLSACERDPFWDLDTPFATAGSTPPDGAGRCRTTATVD